MSIRFDGTGDYGELASGLSLTAWPVTISLWFIDEHDWLDGGRSLVTLSNSTDEDTKNYIRISTAFEGSNTRRVTVAVEDDSSTTSVYNTANAYGDDGAAGWQHIAVRFEDNTTRDYVQDGTVYTPAGLTDVDFPASLNRFTVAATSGGATVNDCYMAELAVWDAALSDANLLTLNSGKRPNLVDSGNLIWYASMRTVASGTPDYIDASVGSDIDLSGDPATNASHPTIMGLGSTPYFMRMYQQ